MIILDELSEVLKPYDDETYEDMHVARSVINAIKSFIAEKLEEDEFELIGHECIKWLCRNSNPHGSIIVTPSSFELVTGEKVYTNHRYIYD